MWLGMKTFVFISVSFFGQLTCLYLSTFVTKHILGTPTSIIIQHRTTTTYINIQFSTHTSNSYMHHIFNAFANGSDACEAGSMACVSAAVDGHKRLHKAVGQDAIDQGLENLE